MKIYHSIIIALAVSAILIGCSEKPPSVRVFNQHTEKANVQFKLSNENTINHNGVEPGSYSTYQNITEGPCEVKAEIDKDTTKPAPSAIFTAQNDYNYTVVIIKGNPSSLHIDQKSK